MRLKLLRRRLSISAPSMIVRGRLPWPLRWAVVAPVLGFSAALALWAFEFGKNVAGLDRRSTDELQQLRIDHPLQAVVKTASVRVMDSSGAVRAAVTAKL